MSRRVNLTVGGADAPSVSFGFLAVSHSSKGDAYAAMPDLLGSLGAHFSFHASGENHFKISALGITVQLPTEQQLKDNLKRAFPQLLKFPEYGDQAHVIVATTSMAAALVAKNVGKEIIVDLRAAIHFARTNTLVVERARLLEIIRKLKAEGKITPGSIVVIQTEEEMCLYKPVAEEDLNKIPDWIPADKMGFIKEIGGLVLTFKRRYKNREEILASPMMQLFEPHSAHFLDALDEIRKNLKLDDHTKVTQLDAKLSELINNPS